MRWDVDVEFKKYKQLNLSFKTNSRILKEEVLVGLKMFEDFNVELFW